MLGDMYRTIVNTTVRYLGELLVPKRTPVSIFKTTDMPSSLEWELTSADNKHCEPVGESSSPIDAPRTPEVPLQKVEQSTRQIEGPWIYPRNLWIVVRYRIPYILTYGLKGEFSLIDS